MVSNPGPTNKASGGPVIISKPLANAIREEVGSARVRLTVKQLAASMGYSRWSVSMALNRGHFTEPILRRFAYLFPSIKQNPAYSSIINQKAR